MCLPAMIQAEFRKYIINDIKSRQNLGSRQGWKISDDVQIQLSFAQANVDQKYFKAILNSSSCYRAFSTAMTIEVVLLDITSFLA